MHRGCFQGAGQCNNETGSIGHDYVLAIEPLLSSANWSLAYHRVLLSSPRAPRSLVATGDRRPLGSPSMPADPRSILGTLAKSSRGWLLQARGTLPAAEDATPRGLTAAATPAFVFPPDSGGVQEAKLVRGLLRRFYVR